MRSAGFVFLCSGQDPPCYTMNFDENAMILMACGTTVPIMSIDNNVWFSGNDCATVLFYKDRAIECATA